jgi:hypothetical protein
MRHAVIGFTLVIGVLSGAAVPADARQRFQIDEHTAAQIGLFAQAWYQATRRAPDGENLNDFMVRRIYFSFQGDVSPWFSAFVHIAADRLGQQGLDQSAMGLGTGIAFRDGWIRLNLHDAFNVQVGRMYVPLTRNYGTTSTKGLLPIDLSFLQGGIQGSIFYASKVGRDDGVSLWGNPFDGTLQYRFMIAEGVEDVRNPDDKTRLVGRAAVNLLEPETTWFNPGTYLGQKRVLALGVGIDYQPVLTLNGLHGRDNLVWLVDLFGDHPLGQGALTVELSYIDVRNSTQTHNLSALSEGDDARLGYVQSGYLLPGSVRGGRMQPYFRYERIAVKRRRATNFYSAGLNYYVRGHNAKVSIDYSRVNQNREIEMRGDPSYLTVQVAIGF